ncbi:predicted protein [Sclerotinia sclerotiorum 1980 UF-70]|uniref:Uncharacterized protein n=1 Tax=Sclerotinia sclerotiorum (strain ATCC 18683 / 1980 / Ss-1) TaxID=665079 RepID=A7EJD4_SCLS1|nr:predicted protein [Sclerotinia sclerotiorum 1980 UF-70]EDO02950.1 predicted protein [Sclerotinia sclerotiorum 1980 UF-70]
MIKRVSMGHREIQFLGYRLVDGTGDDSTRKFSNSLMLPYFSFPVSSVFYLLPNWSSKYYTIGAQNWTGKTEMKALLASAILSNASNHFEFENRQFQTQAVLIFKAVRQELYGGHADGDSTRKSTKA